MNKDRVGNILEVEHLLPKRTSNHGSAPTMASITSSWNPRRQWEFDRELSKSEERIVIAVVVEIALKFLFQNFTYRFGGKSFHQKRGGPIGVRATGAASTRVMEDWAVKYREILIKS